MIQMLLGGKQGGWTLIDDQDDWAVQYRWSRDGRGYVQRRNGLAPSTLHREVMGFPPGVVDHINRDRTDNRRSNLRVVSEQGNAQNRTKRIGLTSTFRGVYRHTQCDRWAATGSLNGKSIHLGLYLSEEAAAEASLKWRREFMPGAVD